MRTLDDIIPPSRRSSRPPAESSAPSTQSPEPTRRRRFPYGTLIGVLIIIAASIGALFYFRSTEVKITPKTRTVTVSGSYMGQMGTGDLPFTVISSQKVATQSVASTGTRAVSSTARGTITISNTQKISQKLIANTRFQTASGLVFRIHTAVTVPAAKGATPGQVNATAFADKAGSEYNIPPSSFTLPGLADSPQYKEVTAKSSVAIEGGGSGNEPVIASDVETSTRMALKSALAQDLQTQLASQVPEGFVLLAGASLTAYQTVASIPSATSGMADVKEQGTITAVVFPGAALAKAVATAALPAEYHGEPISFQDTKGITLTVGALPSASDQSFTFSLAGGATLVYTIDPTRIAAGVAGKSSGDGGTALKGYPEVGQVTIILRPFWRTTFPEDPSSIKVTVESPAAN